MKLELDRFPSSNLKEGMSWGKKDSHPPQQELLKIGQVAQQSGLPIKTIRYYEELGLLKPTVERSEVGYRLFQWTIFNRLDFIKRAKSLGLSLSEIRDILAVRDAGKLPCGVVKQQLEHKLETINEQIASLQLLKVELQSLLQDWEDHPDPGEIAKNICPNLQHN